MKKKVNVKKQIRIFSAALLAGGILLTSIAPVASASENPQQETGGTAELKDYFLEQKAKQGEKDRKAFEAAVSGQLAIKGIQEGSREAEDPTIRVIVQLDKEAAVDDVGSTAGTKANLEKLKESKADALDAQQSVREKVEELTGNKAVKKFSVLINGFSIDCKESDAAKIRKIAGVLDVTASRTFQPGDAGANEIGQAEQAWHDYGVKGEGEVIAVLDSGFDSTHKDLVLTDASKAALNESKVDQFVKQTGYGKFFTDKVPYGYNYADKNDNITDPGVTEMHGMHVAGISAANGDTENGGVSGVAPEAQLLAMKIFSNNSATANSAFDDIVVSAIEDSITLGADVINMSIFSDNGLVDDNDPEQIAVNQAAKAGVTPVICAGNSAVSALADDQVNPTNDIGATDTSMVGSPSTARDAISVAASENNRITVNTLSCPGLTFDGAAELKGAARVFLSITSDYSFMEKDFQLADCGYGTKDDISKTDVKDKVALVKRGTETGKYMSFVDKIKNVQTAGAKGIIIYNNVDEEMEALDIGITDFPVMAISQKNGEVLKQALGTQQTFAFDLSSAVMQNPNADRMSTFSSWGPAPGLEFKPEITAPGSHIYSLANNDRYQGMNGTSMSTPFVAGAIALLDQTITKSGLSIKADERSNFEKTILMNTAKPIMDIDHTKEIISPRRQGAGEVQIASAIKNQVTVTDADTGNASLALKNIDKETSFSVKLTNYGDKEKNYHFNDFGGVYREAEDAGKEIYDTKIEGAALVPDKEEVAVPANSSTSVDFTLKLPDNFEKNNFAEGFIGFDSSDGSQLVIPYMGFFGIYDALPVLAQLKTSADTNAPVDSGYLLSWDGSSEDVLGLDSKTNTIDQDQVAFSPDGDDSYDQVTPCLFFLRNYYSAKYEIVDANDKVIKTIFEKKNGKKNTASSGEWTRSSDGDAAWNGTVYNTKSGKDETVPDGSYQYKITVLPQKDAVPQITYLPVKVDTSAPSASSITYKSAAKSLALNVTDQSAGVDESMGAVSVNGKCFTTALTHVSGDTYEVADIDQYLEQGENDVQVLVADHASNVAIQKTTINYSGKSAVSADTAKPAIDFADKDKNVKLTEKTYHISGQTTASKIRVMNETTGAEVEGALADGSFTADIPVDGQNIIKVIGSDEKGNTATATATVESSPLVLQMKDYITIDQLGTSGTKTISSSVKNYDEAAQTLKVTGKLKQKADKFMLNGETVNYDPQTLKFEYQWKNFKNGLNSLSVYLQDTALNNGQPVIYSGIIVKVDMTMPTLELPGLVPDQNDELRAYTNQSPYEVKALVNDNLAGFRFSVDHNSVYQDIGYEVFNDDFFKGRQAVDVAYPVELEEGENHLVLSIKDVAGNVTSKKLIVDYHNEKIAEPVILADTSEPDNHSVKLSASNQAEGLDLYYSLNGGTDWVKIEEPLTVGANGSVLFKYMDKYGNTSPATTYEVKNIQPEVEANPEVESLKLGKSGIQVIKQGKTLNLSPAVAPESFTVHDISWTFSKEGIAAVDENGLLIGIKPGMVKVTAKAGDKSATVTIRVTQ